MQLLLPPKESNKLNWEDFQYGVGQLGLSIVVMEHNHNINMLVEVNAGCEHMEQEVINLMELCFSKYHIA